MNKTLLLLVPLLCAACTDSSPNDPSATGAMPDTQSEQVVAAAAAAGDGVEAEPAPQANIVTEVIEYTVDGESFTGFLAYDKAIEGERPGVLVVHEWWGHNDYARTRAVQLAELGYTAFALDMYGTGKVADHPDNAMQYMEQALQSQAQVKDRFLAAKDILGQQSVTDSDKIAAIGYCFGGAVVLNMARAGVDLDGVASFHGSLASETAASAGDIEAKILVLHGADDPMVPPEQVEAFKAEMDAAEADYEFIGYEGVKHSFTNPQATEVGQQYNMPLAYDEEADKHSWKALQAFLDSLWNSPEE